MEGGWKVEKASMATRATFAKTVRGRIEQNEALVAIGLKNPTVLSSR